jgi:LmbE family N-acetylglucosaminyl deacetylase
MSSDAEVLIVSPHPDDAEFGVAGTVARWTRNGRRVVYAVCTDGDKGTSDRRMTPERLSAIRRNEQRAAAEVLGVSEVLFLSYPDQGLEETNEFRKHLVRLIRTYKPETVATTDPYRRYLWHRDHRIAGQVVMDAVFPYARDHMAYPDLLAEGLEPHKVREVLFWAAEDINHRTDITDTFSNKLEALMCHKSQMVEFKHIPDMETYLRQRCRENAEGETYELGEAFHRVALPG